MSTNTDDLIDPEKMTHHERVGQGIARVFVALYQRLPQLLHDVWPHVVLHISARSLDDMMGQVR